MSVSGIWRRFGGLAIATDVYTEDRVGSVVFISQLADAFAVIGKVFLEVVGSVANLTKLSRDVDVGYETSRVGQAETCSEVSSICAFTILVCCIDGIRQSFAIASDTKSLT